LRTVFDVETSIFNKGHPFDPRNILVSYSVRFEGSTHFRYYTDPDFISFLRDVIAKSTELVGFNIKFDVHWLCRAGISIPVSCRIWDCMLAEFILAGQTNGFISLNEALESYGLPTKKDQVAEYWAQGISTENIPVPIVEEYNRWDVETTDMLYGMQRDVLSEKQRRLVLLEGDDLLTLAAAEQNGIKWDAEGASKRAMELAAELEALKSRLRGYLPSGIPDDPGFNWDSGDQLSAFLYGGTITYDVATETPSVYKSGEKKGMEYIRRSWSEAKVTFPALFRPLAGTEVAKTLENGPDDPHYYQVDEPTLKQLKASSKAKRELLDTLFIIAKKEKVLGMINSINKKIDEKNWQDNYIHPQFNQNVVITGRLSSSAPNMQNTPPEIDKFLVSRYALD
jgi:DNA polymerase I-like protein with 3'-5' exonuclease and polymerase domains